MTEIQIDQTDIFSSGEGDNWYRRNRTTMSDTKSHDPVLSMIVAAADRGAQFRSVCELGCAKGWRLAALRDELPGLQRLAGSDVSARAIVDGKSSWPEIELTVGSLDEPNIDGKFDVVIVSFVFHWVARERLSKSIAAVDSLVADGGALIIADFLPDAPCARIYHHRAAADVFTYKQDYPAAFLGLGIYSQEEMEIFSHSGGDAPIDPQDRAVCTMLRKNLAAYPIVDAAI